MLRKALDKFPVGTSKRWEQVQAYVRTRTLDEILEMVKHGQIGACVRVRACARVCVGPCVCARTRTLDEILEMVKHGQIAFVCVHACIVCACARPCCVCVRLR